MSTTGTAEASVSAQGIKEAVTRHWWLVLLLGIASIIIGLVALVLFLIWGGAK